MDLNLPGIDGLEATRQILATDELQPVVVALSTDTGLATKALASGARTFIAKEDFDPDRLADAWASARA
jgi:CheY-like chemotaxis protein